MDISLPPLPEPIPTNSPSLRGKLLIFSLSVLLLISLVGSGWLFTENVNYISLQKALIKDLVLTADNNLFVNSYTENYAMISNSGTCMILKKSDGVWTVLDSSGCSDPSWNAREGSLSTVLRRDYGIPPEDAEVLAN